MIRRILQMRNQRLAYALTNYLLRFFRDGGSGASSSKYRRSPTLQLRATQICRIFDSGAASILAAYRDIVLSETPIFSASQTCVTFSLVSSWRLAIIALSLARNTGISFTPPSIIHRMVARRNTILASYLQKLALDDRIVSCGGYAVPYSVFPNAHIMTCVPASHKRQQ